MWGQPVVVENRAGAGTLIGTRAAAQAKPDGYTLMVAYTELATLPSLNSKLPFDVINDFAPVSKIGVVPAMIATSTSVSANTLPELIAELKDNPGKYTYSSGGPGSIMQLFGELFKKVADVDVLHVPYKGSVEATLSVLAGEVDMMVQFASANMVNHVNAGKVKGVAITVAERDPRLPQIPTTAEAGLPEYQVEAWYGVFAPANIPSDILNKVNKDIAKVLAMPEIKEKLVALGITAQASSPEEFGQFFQAEHDLWAQVIKDAGIHSN